MKIAYFDCTFGAAGDMLNAALIAAGADEKRWRDELSKLALPEGSFQTRIYDVMRCNIACKKLDVLSSQGLKFDTLYAQQVGHSLTHSNVASESEDHHHPGDHHHEHDYEHEHEHEHHRKVQQKQKCSDDQLSGLQHSNRSPANADPQGERQSRKKQQQTALHHHRGLNEIVDLIERSKLSTQVKRLSQAIFTRLARAEAKVHAVSPNDVLFHEVGAIDAIVDVVGFAVGYELLAIEQSFASAIAMGAGKTITEHGIYPVPGPATLYLLEEVCAPAVPGNINFECLTPTGAAVLCEVVQQWGAQPGFARLEAVGYGAGTMDPHDWPNACRIMIGDGPAEEPGDHFDSETVCVLEANLDDLSPQALSFAVQKIFDVGALDVYVVPAVMKKGRPGHILTALCPKDMLQSVRQIVFAETSTIGVRYYEARRAVARRRFQTVRLQPGGEIRLKIASDNTGKILNVQPEYDDCAAFALKHGVPLKQVFNQALSAYFGGDDTSTDTSCRSDEAD